VDIKPRSTEIRQVLRVKDKVASRRQSGLAHRVVTNLADPIKMKQKSFGYDTFSNCQAGS
jgi:hypothetical protein